MLNLSCIESSKFYIFLIFNVLICISIAALLAEAREINMARLNNGDKHLSACNNQSTLILENVFKDINLHIHKDIDRMVRYACKSCPSEQKLMMIWTTLVQPFVSISYQLQESNGTVAPKEACEHCGLSKTFLRSIPDSSLANNFSLSSMVCACIYNTIFFQIHLNSNTQNEFLPHRDISLRLWSKDNMVSVTFHFREVDIF
jgi:paired amphipathic helix protein Sin3a